MKRLALLLLALLALAAPVRAQTVSPFVTVSGSSLIYNGQTVILRGENFPNLPALDAWPGAHGVIDNINTDESDYAALEAMGANHARLGLNYRWYHDNRTQFFRVIDQQVAWAKAHHLWLILLQFTTPAFCYEGYGTSCSLWNSSSEQDALNTFWTDVALHYKNEPTIAGYDLLNEPTPPGRQSDTWYALAERLCNSIAGVDVNHFVVVESTSDPTFPRLLNCPRVVYSVHIYAPLGFTTGASGVYPGTLREWDGRGYLFNAQTIIGNGAAGLNDLQTRYSVAWARRNNVALYIGEWGARAKASGSLQYIADIASAFNEWGISYAHYDMRHNAGEWGIYGSDGPLTTPANPGLYNVMASAFAGSVQPDTAVIPPAPTIVVEKPTDAPTPSPTLPQPTVGPVSATPTPTDADVTLTPTPSPVPPTVPPTNTPRPGTPVAVACSPVQVHVSLFSLGGG